MKTTLLKTGRALLLTFTIITFSVGSLFKILHWEYANELRVIGVIAFVGWASWTLWESAQEKRKG